MKTTFNALSIGQVFEFQADLYVKMSCIQAQKIALVCTTGAVLHLNCVPDPTIFQGSWQVQPIVVTL